MTEAQAKSFFSLSYSHVAYCQMMGLNITIKLDSPSMPSSKAYLSDRRLYAFWYRGSGAAE